MPVTKQWCQWIRTVSIQRLGCLDGFLSGLCYTTLVNRLIQRQQNSDHVMYTKFILEIIKVSLDLKFNQMRGLTPVVWVTEALIWNLNCLSLAQCI